jgi:hypothetical protein
LTTSPIPYSSAAFEIWFDFIAHKLVLLVSDGHRRRFRRPTRPVADFYRDFVHLLHSSGINVRIWKMPVEIPFIHSFRLPGAGVLPPPVPPRSPGRLQQVAQRSFLYTPRTRR